MRFVIQRVTESSVKVDGEVLKKLRQEVKKLNEHS